MKRPEIVFGVLLALIVSGCGTSTPEASTTTRTSTAEAPTTGTTADKTSTESKPHTTTDDVPSTGTTDTATAPTGTIAETIPIQPETDLADTIAKVRSGVVRINVTTCNGSGSGTGVIVGGRYVVTVEHVIDGASRIDLERSRNKLGSAEVIGVDRDRDLALLRLKKPITGFRFQFAERAPRLGEEVAALGYPLGLPLSVSRGTVSGLNRTISIDKVKRRALVQTDAAVNHGNSGGPLLSVDTGEIIGLVDLGSTEVNGIAFAVSGAVAHALVDAWRAAPQPHPVEKCPRREVAPAPPSSDTRGVGVPDRYEGRFTSVDRLQRCYATDLSVVCHSGPSGKAVELQAGGSVYDLGRVNSTDEGGPSMPMGTSFTTPSGTIRCDSSRRGITCSDQLGSGAFTIGDYALFINP